MNIKVDESFKIIVGFICVLVLSISFGYAEAASRNRELEGRLKSDFKGCKNDNKLHELHVANSSKGFLEQLKTSAGSHVALGNKKSDKDISDAFLEKYRDLLHNGQAEVNFVNTGALSNKTKRSHSILRYDQEFSGIPVVGAEVVIQMDDSGGVNYVLNDVMHDFDSITTGELSLIPTISAEVARATACDFVKDCYGVSEVEASEGTLMIYDPEVVGSQGEVSLVYCFEISNPQNFVHEVVFVDAHSNKINLNYSLINHDVVRVFYVDYYDAALDQLSRYEMVPNPLSVSAAVNKAVMFHQDCMDFYLTINGRWTMGIAEIHSVRIEVNLDMENACYSRPNTNVDTLSFGTHWLTDDIFAHEYTHGVTANGVWGDSVTTRGLMYYSQSGAINESLSDMWGEWIDLTYHHDGDRDADGYRWQIGEDKGTIRYMKNPGNYGDPDYLYGSNWYYGTEDCAGVHTNCGVGNKLCYLITDGGSFNGYEIVGLGIPNAAKLVYNCHGLLSRTATYRDFSTALLDSADNLIQEEVLLEAQKASVAYACCAVGIYHPGNWIYTKIPDQAAGSLEGNGNVTIPIKIQTPWIKGKYNKNMIVTLHEFDNIQTPYTIPVTLTFTE